MDGGSRLAEILAKLEDFDRRASSEPPGAEGRAPPGAPGLPTAKKETNSLDPSFHFSFSERKRSGLVKSFCSRAQHSRGFLSLFPEASLRFGQSCGGPRELVGRQHPLPLLLSKLVL